MVAGNSDVPAPNGTPVAHRKVIFRRGDLIYTISLELFGKASPKVAEDLDRARDSFRMLE